MDSFVQRTLGYVGIAVSEFTNYQVETNMYFFVCLENADSTSVLGQLASTAKQVEVTVTISRGENRRGD